MRTIQIGETPANCAFGDADFGALYITARTSVYRIRLDVKGLGAILAGRYPGVPGAGRRRAHHRGDRILLVERGKSR